MTKKLRSTVDAYLSGITPEEMELLDAATKKAQADIAEMATLLDATNRKADRIFAELEQLYGDQPPHPAGEASVTRKVKTKRSEP